MKYVVNSICELIVNNSPSTDGKMMIRIDGFEDVRIYEALAKRITKEFQNTDLSINIKLAKSKWNHFCKNNIETSVLQSLQQNGWIAEAESITHYRNLHDSNILILMGTEDEEDKGGLLNCYTITQDTLVNLLDGNYHEVFNEMTNFFNDSEIKNVNKLYKDLFEFISIDICKISNYADKWEGHYFNVMDFMNLFYESLPEWGLPFKKIELPSAKDLDSKKNVLRPEYGFISRQSFKNLTGPKYKKYKEQLDNYNDKKEEYSDGWEGWANQGIDNYLDFSKVILEYIRGENVSNNRMKLLSVDFSIVESIFDMKVAKEKAVSKTTTTLHGEPLKVFTKVLLYMLSEIKSQNNEIKKICIDISQAEILCMYSNIDNEEKNQQLLKNWSNVCRHTNGVIKYINNRYWDINNNEISFECKPSDAFSPKSSIDFIEEGKVKAAGANKKYSKITFDVKCYTKKDQNIKEFEKKYEWRFQDTSDWLNNFLEICSQDFFNLNDSSYIPIATMENINTLLFAKSEEEFFDLYEENNINFDFNLLSHVEKKANHTSVEYSVGFVKLGKRFTEFIYDLSNNGFYNCIGKSNSTLNNLVKEYIDLGNVLLSKSLPENMKWIVDTFIHAFSIEKNIDVIKHEKYADCCIVPPWHPATLEKLSDQKVFFLDGCKEWWEDNKGISKIGKTTIDNAINNLLEKCQIQSSLDIFPSHNQQYFGMKNSFGSFSVYARKDMENNGRLKDMIHKDAIYDDDFDKKEFSQMNDNAQMIYDVIKDYLKAFPSAYCNLSIVFVDPSELQPIIAAIYRYINQAKKSNSNNPIDIQLKILVKPENKGGRNYLKYWMNEFFSQDDDVNIRMYLNEWKTKSDLDNLLDGNNDILFVMDLLKVNNMQFTNENTPVVFNTNDCRFPIVYRPSPTSSTSVIRKIELSQPQFSASYAHTQVVHFRNHLEVRPIKNYIAVRESKIDKDVLDIVSSMHEKAYWVVCIDAGMDGALLRTDKRPNNEYSIIGFSTGKGSYGQYNLTITARKSILEIITKKLESRFYQLFHWEKEQVKKAVKVCLNEASALDGISLFSAINQKDHNINEFMAYVLTSLIKKSQQTTSPLKLIIHLDSYQHWFNSFTSDTKTRPDFLILEVNMFDDEKLDINATVIECKISTEHYSRVYKEKAYNQVISGINRLKAIFDPKSKSIKRRYWRSQLYRALTFSQITFSDNTTEFSKFSSKLRSILNGNFSIKWKGKVLGFWLDMDGTDIRIEDTDYEEIKTYDVPQLYIQELMLQNKEMKIDYVDIEDTLICDDEIRSEETLERQKELDDEMKELQKPIENKKYIKYDFTNTKEIVEDKKVAEETTEREYAKVNTDTNIIQREDNIADKELVKIKKHENISNDENGRLIELGNIRVKLGSDIRSEEIYWEFGHKSLANRHVLITGTSGQGKTYAIQTMLYELSKYNISSVVFDYTEGFRKDQLEATFIDSMGDKIIEHIVYYDGVPINPFKRHEIDISGRTMSEKVSDVALRIANIFTHVYTFGEQQFSALFEASRIGMVKYGDKMNMKFLQDELENIISTNTSAKTVISKMAPFFHSIEFKDDKEFDWGEILYSDREALNIFQLTAIDREMQVIITELMLWDAWYFTKKYGNKDKPFVVVLDEAQNLSHKTNSPSASILTEGRKFGWSAWFATQSLKILADEEVVRLLQAAYKLYFKPTDDEVVKISKQLDPTKGKEWLDSIKRLTKGQCIIVGDRIKQDRKFGLVKPTITNITSFEERD